MRDPPMRGPFGVPVAESDRVASTEEPAVTGHPLDGQGMEAQAGDARTMDGPAGDARSTVGLTVWFTGLPSAGKSTIATALAARLTQAGVDVEVLDGDQVRPRLSSELGFSAADRDLNVRRIGWVARLLAAHGVVVLVPVIAPYAASRDAVRADHRAAGVGFAEVHVATPLAVAEERDVKGLYARARRGELARLTGVDDPYEPPSRPDLVLDTSVLALDEAVEQSLALVSGRAEPTRSRP